MMSSGSSLLIMRRASLIAVTLAVVYLLLSFNAYACLIPLYGGMQVAQGSDCSMPGEHPARQHCDAFKSLSVQGASPVLQALDASAHAILAAEAVGLLSCLPPLHQSARLWIHSPPSEDVLALTSVLRL